MKRSLFEGAAQTTLTVGELCQIIKRSLENLYPGPIRVVGEVSKFYVASSGHMYFDLKDHNALVSCVCWRTAVELLAVKPPMPDGFAVEVVGRLSTYAPRSQYQLIVEDIVPVGFGELYRRFEQLKTKLAAEGLFDAERKRAIPSFIRRVALVTSREAAALGDFVTTARRRGAHVAITLVHSPVQGAVAAGALARAIRFAGSLDVDVVVVARGGGSIEDLWAFNTELVARAIARCAKPVITAIGHETDFTIADFVADRRAATPTAAAEIVAAERLELLDRLQRARHRLRRGLQRLAEQAAERFERIRREWFRTREAIVDVRLRRVDELSADLVRFDPRRTVRELERRLADWRHRLRLAAVGAQERRHKMLEVLAASIAALGPESTLSRGYAIVYNAGGKVVTDSGQVAIGEPVDIRLRRGGVGAVVREKRKPDEQSEFEKNDRV